MRFEVSLGVAFDTCYDGIVVAEVTPGSGLQVVYANPAFCRRAQRSQEDLIGRFASARFASDAKKSLAWEKIPNEALEGQCLALQIRVGDGAVASPQAVAWLIPDSESHRLYAAFRQQPAEPNSAAIVDSTAACIITTDVCGRVTGWNEGAARLTGYSAEEMMGQSVEILYPGDSRVRLADDIIPRLKKDGCLHLDAPVKCKDGTLRHVAMSLSVIPSRAGAPSRFVGVSVDAASLQQRAQGLEARGHLLESICRLQRLLISSSETSLVAYEALATLVLLSGSQSGFLAEVVLEKREPSFRVCSSLTLPAPSVSVNQVPPGGVLIQKTDGLIWQAIKEHKPQMADGEAIKSLRTGLPEPCCQPASLLAVPLGRAGDVIGLVVLMNRAGGYDESLIAAMQPLLDFCSHLSELCRDQDAARARQELWRQCFKNNHTALLRTDPAGSILDWNLSAVGLLKYPEDQIIGKSVMALGKDWDADLLDRIARALRDSGYWGQELTLQTFDGREIRAEVGVLPSREDSSQWMWIIRDVTARRETERALKEASERFDAFVQNSKTAFWLQSVDTHKLLYASPAFEKVTGLLASEVVEERQRLELVHPEDRERFRNALRATERGETVRFKYRLLPGDGRSRWIQSHVFPVKDDHGMVKRFAGLMEDVTEYEEAHARLSAAVAERDALLKEVHHRVKNNLQIISSLLRLHSGSVTGDSAGILQECRNRVDTIALIHDQLYQDESPSHINLQSYVSRLIGKVTGMSQLSDRIRVTKKIAPVLLDPKAAVLCGLILNELVANSLRHAFPGDAHGSIAIKVEQLDGSVSMSVSDNGIGMPAGFDPLKISTLGLKLVRQLSLQLKGEMTVQNNGGTTVEVRFPIDRAD